MWKRLKQRFGSWRGRLAIVPSVAVTVALGSSFGIFQWLEWAISDRFFMLRPPQSVDDRITIVTVSEADIANLTRWPMFDRVMARLLNNILAGDPRVIGIDIYRDIPVPPGHQTLVDVFTDSDKIIGIEKVAGETIDPPPALAEKGQAAASDILIDSDSKVRRAAVLIGTPEQEFRQGLGVDLALRYLAKEGLELSTIDDDRNIYGLGKATFIPLTGKEWNYDKSDTGGYQILLNYRGRIDRFDRISLTDVLENRIPEDLFRDRVVLIGATAESLKDYFHTPYSHTWFGSTEPMAGVAIHANITSQVLDAALDGRTMFVAISERGGWLWILVWSGVGTFGSWKILESHWFYRNVLLLGTLSVIFVAGSAIVGIGYVAFLNGWIVPIFAPLLALVSAAILTTNYHDRHCLERANEKLSATNQELEETNQELGRANQKLEDYSHTLEDKVTDRTRELKETLDNLRRTQTNLIQAEKMAALGQMVAGIAHEINNPTSFIYGNISYAENYIKDLFSLLDLYRETYPDASEEIQELAEEIELEYLRTDLMSILKSIKGGASRIEEIVKGLRTFSRLDESDIKAVDLHEGIQIALRLLNNRLSGAQNKVPIQVITEFGSLPKVNCNARQINQVFMNTIVNAIDALEERTKKLDRASLDRHPNTITIKTEFLEGAVAISIADNGLGIPESILPRIFEPFYTTKAVGKGTGLGLSIAHSIIVEQHRGQLNVRSHPGEGTEFRIEIPCQQKSDLNGNHSATNT